MTDYFLLLQEERRPWLEAEQVKQKFFALSGSAHPDRVHQAGAEEKAAAGRAFADLNSAAKCLGDHKLRLLHLLELEMGAKPKDVQEIPNELANLFTGVATACRNADQFLAEKAKVTSPLLQVALFAQAMEWVEKLQQLQQNLTLFNAKLLEQLQTLDEAWMAAAKAERRGLLPQLEELYRLFGYFNRWNSQIQERIVQLSF
jgi:hypothetical protein